MANRITTHVLKNSDNANRTLPQEGLLAGEPIVNIADGILYFSGRSTSLNNWVPAGPTPILGSKLFEVGSNLYDLQLRNRLTKYEGATGSGLVGKFLSGTTNGFVLANISSIAGIDTFTSGFTYSPTTNTITLSQTQGRPDLPLLINTMSGLTVNGTLAATTGNISTINTSNLNATGITVINNVTASAFIGNLTGLASLATSATTALNATNVGVTNNTTTNATYYITFASATTGTTPLQVDNNTLTFNPSTNTLAVANVNGLAYSATTALNAPVSGMYSAGTLTLTNLTGGTFNVTGLTSTDTFTTGFTYNNNNVATIKRNQGQADLSILINTMTGLTVNGVLSATTSNITTANVTTLSATSGTITTLGSTTANLSTANINTLNATGGTVTTLASTTANLGTANATTANINTLNATGGTVTTLGSTTANLGTANVTTLNATGGTVTTLGSTTANLGTANINTLNATGATITTLGSTTLNLGRIASYSGNTNLSGQFLSGTTNGFVLGAISAITGVDTFVTGFTYSPTANTITLSQNQGQANRTITINAMTGLTVNGTLSASTYLNLPISIVDTNNLVSTGLPGSNAASTTNSILFGIDAGKDANDANASNFFGQNAGFGAPDAGGSNFFGQNAGSSAGSAEYSNFLGSSAGSGATAANNSNFFGRSAGQGAKSANNSNFFGQGAGFGANDGKNVGYFNSNFFGENAGFGAKNANHSNFFGKDAGYLVNGGPYFTVDEGIFYYDLFASNFFGPSAGQYATNAYQSNFFGQGAGSGATSANNSNFLGNGAGRDATSANNSNFLGTDAGTLATDAYQSNFIGYDAGVLATGANNSNFIGYFAGAYATSANNSNFLGFQAGIYATGASYSNLFGYNVGNATNLKSLGSNNIIIGTNISLPSGTTNSLNIGGILFGSGTYSNINGNPSIIGQTQGRIGINVVNPTEALHVSGNTLINGNFTATTISATTGNITTANVNTLNATGGTVTSLSSTTLNLGRIATYSGQTNLSGQFLSGTTNGFILAPISGITGVDTFTTGFTYNNNNVATIKRNQGQADLSILINTMTGLTVNGVLSATTSNSGTANVNTLNATSGTITTLGSTTATLSTANVNTLNATGGTVTSLSSTTATLSTGNITTANINTLNATGAIITTLGSTTTNINTLNATGGTVTSLSSTTLNLGRIASYSGNTNLTGQYLAGSANGFILAPISGITGIDTFVTGFTYSPTTNTITLSQNQGRPDLPILINTMTGLTVSDLTANRLVYATTNGRLITGSASFDGTNTILPSSGSLNVGTGGLTVGNGGSPGQTGTGDVVINGSLTVFGNSVSAFTSQLYVEDSNVTLNFNPTGSTIATSLGAGLTVQDGNGIQGGNVNFEVRAMNNFSGLTGQAPLITEYNGTTNYANRAWVTQLNDIVIRSTNIERPTGVRVLAEFDILDGGVY